MSIQSILKNYQKGGTLPVYTALDSLSKHCNSAEFCLSESIEKSTYSPFVLATIDFKNPDNFYLLLNNRGVLSFLNLNVALIRCVAEILNPSNSVADLNNFLNHVVSGFNSHDVYNRMRLTTDTPTAYVFGLVLGAAIKRGLDGEQFFKNFSGNFLYHNEIFLRGVTAGLNEEIKSSRLDTFYVGLLTEKYFNNNKHSFSPLLKILNAIFGYVLNSTDVNAKNLVLLESFEFQSSRLDVLINRYREKLKSVIKSHISYSVELDFKSLKEGNEYSMIEALNEMSVKGLKSERESVGILKSLEDSIEKKTNELLIANEHLESHKLIIKEFFLLMPELEEVMQNSNRRDSLLDNVKRIVSQKNTSLRELEQYYLQNQRNKRIKEKINRIL